MADKIEITKTDVRVKYSDVFDVQISPDTELGKKTRAFLEFFEQAKFEYAQQDPKTGVITTQFVSGQDMLMQAKEKSEALQSIFKDSGGLPGGILPNGKIPIKAAEGVYNGTLETGSATKFGIIKLGQSALSVPVNIQLSEDYIKRSDYMGEDGKLHPVTLDGVLANELCSACTYKDGDEYSIGFENIVIVSLGAEQRVSREASIKSKPEPCPVIETLYDKATLVEPKPPEIKLPEQGKAGSKSAIIDPSKQLQQAARSNSIG